jgi:hypothetical protein
MKHNHVMLDLETMGQGSDAAIIAIGATTATLTIDAEPTTPTQIATCTMPTMSFYAHMAATLSCNGLLHCGQNVIADQCALTGVPDPISKCEALPFVLSGTSTSAGQGACSWQQWPSTLSWERS